VVGGPIEEDHPFGGSAAGSVESNVAPSPGAVSTQMRPQSDDLAAHGEADPFAAGVLGAAPLAHPETVFNPS